MVNFANWHDRSERGRLCYRLGREIEETCLIALRYLLGEIGLDRWVTVERAFNHAPYDLIVVDRLPKKRILAYLEVKMAFTPKRLRDRVVIAFKKEHPEPFAVIGVLEFYKDPLALLKRAWLYRSPDRRRRLTKSVFKGFLAPYLKF